MGFKTQSSLIIFRLFPAKLRLNSNKRFVLSDVTTLKVLSRIFAHDDVTTHKSLILIRNLEREDVKWRKDTIHHSWQCNLVFHYQFDKPRTCPRSYALPISVKLLLLKFGNVISYNFLRIQVKLLTFDSYASKALLVISPNGVGARGRKASMIKVRSFLQRTTRFNSISLISPKQNYTFRSQ